ncbi:hypothetical protein PhCBS80983_g03986 [Powellomyces hirtus]|uniref:adenylate cyclase n=1 Tax=Powellomyces hirtus TaxID=109895 RepID=A0A507E0H6_9FUNG|nr:hypothetical protein PhCBS80983_g03986 [Powellomyces hirtus]
MWERASNTASRKWKQLVTELTSTYDIPSRADLPSDSDTSLQSGDDNCKSSTLSVPSPNLKTSRILVNNDAEANVEEDEAVSFTNLGALGDGVVVLKQFMNPLTFQFRNARIEEHYFRTHLLPNRLLHMRLLAFLQLLQYSIIMYPTYEAVSHESASKRFRPAYIAVWMVSTIMWLFLLVAAIWHRGKVYIWLCLRSRKIRTIVTIGEIVAVALSASWDFFLSESPSQPNAPLSTMAILYFAISSGFASTYREGVVGIIFVLAVCAGKLAWIAASTQTPHDAVVYAVPIVITLIVAQGLLFAGDRNRRISYIKYQVVEERLAQMKLERMKTDYLLSLSLPKTIVNTLREVGATNFDLIAKRITNATVMFGDLKNFKEVASTLGSTKEALTLLNGIFQYMDELIEEYDDLTKIKTISTKILFVGGLHGTQTHHLQMIDMAVQMRDYFRSSQTYTIGDQEVPIKLDIEFGVATGPLVAGIVGRKKFVYEIYGDVVNTSSRMCSLAHEDQIIITENVQRYVCEGFETISLGTRAVKGKGVVPIFSVEDAIDDGSESFERRYKKRMSSQDDNIHVSPARINQAIVGSALAKTALATGTADHILGHRKSIRTADQSFKELERTRSIPAISGKRLDQYVSATALSGLHIADLQKMAATASEKAANLNKYLSGSVILPMGAGGGIMDTHSVAKRAMDVAKMGSPLTLQKTARTGLTHVDSEWRGPRVTFTPQSPVADTSMDAGVGAGPGSSDDGINQRPLVDYGRRGSVRNVLVAETADDPDAKEVLLDVVKRMGGKIDINTATGLSYLKTVNEEIDPIRVRFKHRTIERCYRGDLTADTAGPFVKAGAIALFSEILLYFLAIYNGIEYNLDLINDKSAYYTVLGTGIASVGLQLLVTGVTVFAASDDAPPSRSFLPRQIMFLIAITTFFIACLCTILPWSRLYHYPFLCSCVIPHLAFFFCMRIEGVIFTYRLFASVVVGTTLTIIPLILDEAVWQEAVCVFLSSGIWCVVFYLLEKRNRFDYLIDLILETQAELVTEEIEKSAGVLHSILPQAVILKLLEDPTTIAYEELEMVTVLHMDIAGFTSMSSNLEPLTIVKVLNTLFTFFDHLTEEYGVEKITTIGDAYVACSSLSETADPKIGALSICLVALQMQAYLETQLNMSQIVLQVLKNPLKMRIGIHTGPAHGAIMGGPKNFRYDVMGDTVLNAEKTQERCPIGEVSITNVTYNCVRDYHGFRFIAEENPGLPTSLKAYTLKAADERIVLPATDADHDGMPAPAFNRSRSASFQKRPITAATARKESLGGGGRPPSAGKATNVFGAATTSRKATTLAKIHPTMEEED